MSDLCLVSQFLLNAPPGPIAIPESLNSVMCLFQPVASIRPFIQISDVTSQFFSIDIFLQQVPVLKFHIFKDPSWAPVSRKWLPGSKVAAVISTGIISPCRSLSNVVTFSVNCSTLFCRTFVLFIKKLWYSMIEKIKNLARFATYT